MVHCCYANPNIYADENWAIRTRLIGNPVGPSKNEACFAELARSYTIEAIDTLRELMRHGKYNRVRGTATHALLDRGCGKPKVEMVNESGGGYLKALKNAPTQII